MKVFPGREQDVLAVVAGRKGDEKVFTTLLSTDIHAYRRQFAQEFTAIIRDGPFPASKGGSAQRRLRSRQRRK